MKQVAWSELIRQKAGDVADGASFEITRDGDVFAVVIIGTENEMLNRARILAGQIDAARGK